MSTRSRARTGVSWGGGRRRTPAVLGVAVLAASGLIAGVTTGTASAAGTYDPAADNHSMKSITSITGATAWWNAGYTGAGVDVALIDTGVAPVQGLDASGKIIDGPDLSFESQSPGLTHLDTNGHGTFMAGLIAGKDATLTAPYANAPASAYRGIAPDARIVNVKVGVADGGVDVSQVIAAIDWVVAHKNDNGLNIRVISLSYGTNSTQSATIDPLSYAAERAWKQGIVVVAAAGNSGFQNERGLASPANNRFVIGVGGYDTAGTASPADDALGAYSAGIAHSADRGPDFVAPGSHTQGLRLPNGHLDVFHPEGILSDRYFRGSGTSQAAAITSGAVALILQKHPGLTPDRVKRFIAANTSPATGVDPDPDYWGSGKLNLAALITKAPEAYTQNFTNATGTGSLEAARGTDHVADNGVELRGEMDIFGNPFNSSAVAAATAAGTIWNGGTFNGRTWSGSTWSGRTWSGTTWSGGSWSGRTWSSRTWSGNTWSSRTWSSRTWSGGSWSGSTWSGNTWSGGAWS